MYYFCGMRRVRTLAVQERNQLEYGYKSGKTHTFRIRCKIILLSDDGKSARQISEQLEVDTDTVYTWLKRYEAEGYSCFKNRKGQGRKSAMSVLNKEQVARAKAVVENHPQNLNKAAKKLSKEFGFSISKWMLIRFVKKN